MLQSETAVDGQSSVGSSVNSDVGLPLDPTITGTVEHDDSVNGKNNNFCKYSRPNRKSNLFKMSEQSHVKVERDVKEQNVVQNY